MNYIYDIYLNLNKNLYDFFDWNSNDKLYHIKKIPIFKISVHNLKDLISNNIIIDNNILKRVHNSTEIFNLDKKIEYCALFCDDNNIIAIEFNKNGENIKKSYLAIEEELDILDNLNIKETKFNYKIINKECVQLSTRKQLNIKKFITNELNNIENDKLNYIYLECFGKKTKNKTNIINKLKKINTTSKTYKNLYNILKLTSTNKNT